MRPEHFPNPHDTPTAAIVRIADYLHHCNFSAALTEVGEAAFYQVIARYADQQTSGVGEVVVKIPLRQNNDHSHETNEISYIGMHYNLVTNDEGVTLEAAGLLIPPDGATSLADDPDLHDAEIIDLGYNAFRWDESC